MSAILLILGIIFLVAGVCNIIGAIIVSRFDFGRGKIEKYNDIHEKFERNYSLENFIGAYSRMGGFMLLFIGFLFIAGCFMPAKAYTPTAIDVYRGNTTLKITSIDGVPQDTVVVWKDVVNK